MPTAICSRHVIVQRGEISLSRIVRQVSEKQSLVYRKTIKYPYLAMVYDDISSPALFRT